MAGHPSESNLMALPPVPILNELNEVPLARKLLTSALQSLQEALSLVQAPGAPRRSRRRRHGPPPLVVASREHPRCRLRPPLIRI